MWRLQTDTQTDTDTQTHRHAHIHEELCWSSVGAETGK